MVFMRNLMDSHMHVIPRILHYVKGILHHDLCLYLTSVSTLMCPTLIRIGVTILIHNYPYLGTMFFSVIMCCLHFPKDKQPYHILVLKAEYGGITNVVIEFCWISNLLLELLRPIVKATRLLSYE